MAERKALTGSAVKGLMTCLVIVRTYTVRRQHMIPRLRQRAGVRDCSFVADLE